jgi:hypothetical protein
MLIDGGPGLSRYPYRRERPFRPVRTVRPSLRVVASAR